MKAVALWSGGKDSCLATYKAMESGLEIAYLLNYTSTNGHESLSHHLNPQLISLQAGALGIPFIQQPTSKGGYEQVFKKTVAGLKNEGVEAGVFGDIYLQTHKDWVDRVCEEAGIKAIFPLWKLETGMLFQEFVGRGFKAIIVCVKANLFSKDWLGRELDEGFISDLNQLSTVIDPCGENGEFHTLVTDGPIFDSKIEIESSQPMIKDGRWYLDISSYRTVKK